MDDKSLTTMLESIRADFRAGKETRFTSRLTDVMPSGSGADYHYKNEYQYFKSIERSRHYERNDSVVGQGLRRLVANVVQDGFSCDFSTGDSGVDNEWKARWKEWSEDADQCDSEGEKTFAQQEQMGLLSVLRDGDILSLPRHDGALQWVENHRLRTPFQAKRNIVHGVEMADGGKRARYWVTNEDLSLLSAAAIGTKFTPIEARDSQGNRNALHLYLPTRFSQRRGVTVLAPCTDMVGMHDDLQFTTLVKQQMAALIAILRTRTADWEPGGDVRYGERVNDTSTSGYVRPIEGIEAGLEIASDKGETITAFSSNIPSSEFFQHASLILTFIGINLDLPLCVLLLDPTKTNFSGWRGAIDQARMRFRQLQSWYAGAFHNPTTKWQIRRWINSDSRLKSLFERRQRLDPFAFTWHPPGFPYVDPTADIACDVMQSRTATNSMRRIQAARGRDWDEVSTEIVEDNAKAIRKALQATDELNAEFAGANITWREVLNLPTPEGVQIALSPVPQSTPEPVKQGGNDVAA
ncbi:MAG: phage portal protein [Planctomycetota bacterium]